MAITNGYATLDEFKKHLTITTYDTDDDAAIENIIEGASRMIDNLAGRWFYPKTETRYYDVPEGREIHLDEDLLTVTTLTNGDGTVITSTYFSLIPRNHTPKHSLIMKTTSNYSWAAGTDGDTEGVISIAGTWGYAATTPDDIRQACLDISLSAYKRRTGENTTGVATVTAAGVVITPQDIPGGALAIIRRYKRHI